MPPPSTVGRSCLYVLRRSDGRFYCGQTDELKGRLTRHRRAGRVKGGVSLEAAYLVLPVNSQGSSTAKAIEAQLIQVYIFVLVWCVIVSQGRGMGQGVRGGGKSGHLAAERALFLQRF